MMSDYLLIQGDARRLPLADESVHCCVTSPPYWGLRSYGCQGEIGLESTYQQYVAAIVAVAREVRRVLRKDGTFWMVIGDTYATDAGSARRPGGKFPASQPNRMKQRGLKPKDLVGIPWRVAFALQDDGWWLRSDCIWDKTGPTPEGAKDRPTRAHEYIFLFTKSRRYFYNWEAVSEPAKYAGKVVSLGQKSLSKGQANGMAVQPSGNGKAESVTVQDRRNRRSVWRVPRPNFSGGHFATYPRDLAKVCIFAGCPEGGTVLDPFNGAATTALAALTHGRRYVGVELNPKYLAMSRRRIERPHAPVPRNHEPMPLFDREE